MLRLLIDNDFNQIIQTAAARAAGGLLPKRIAKRGLIGLPIEHAHALHVETLPAIHKDPFDRLLVAQAQIESLTLLTADTWVTKYGGSIIWAGSRQLS